MNKKGSHIGMMLSFVIFIVFVVFIFSLLAPSMSLERNKQTYLNHIRTTLLEKWQTELTQTKIDITQNTGSCFLIEKYAEGNVIVRNSGGEVIGADIEEEKIEISSSTDGIYYIDYSSEIIPTLTDLSECKPVKNSDYLYTKKGDYVAEQKISKDLSQYNLDYDGLKKELGIPGDAEFGFEFEDSDGERSVVGESMAENIYTLEETVQYMDIKGNIKMGKVKFLVW